MHNLLIYLSIVIAASSVSVCGCFVKRSERIFIISRSLKKCIKIFLNFLPDWCGLPQICTLLNGNL